MAKVINTKIDDGILIFTFTNNEDEVFSSFKLNPTDINVAARAEELTEYFEQLKDSIQKVTSGKRWRNSINRLKTRSTTCSDTKHQRTCSRNRSRQLLFSEMVRYSLTLFLIKSQKQFHRKSKREKRKCRQQLISIRRSIQNDRL